MRCLLLQVRDPGDAMAPHEVEAFRRILAPLSAGIEVFDLLGGPLRRRHVEGFDLILMGGSGSHSATSTEPWLEVALDSLRLVHALRIPSFASCWGHQAMAAAMGGTVVHDQSRAELGTHEVVQTPAGLRDPVFAPLGSPFKAQFGHEDLVEELPPRTTLLASGALVVNQAYRFDDAPIYCTQFHPELDACGIRSRAENYPRYVEKVLGITLDELIAELEETPDVEGLVLRFAQQHA